MAAILTVSDLPAAIQSSEMAQTMVDGANGKASRVAPCLTWDGTDAAKPKPSSEQLAEARMVLIGAITRWTQAGSGALSSQSAGPFAMQVDTRQRTGYNLWPSEIEALQDICASGAATRQAAFSITPTGSSAVHMPWCALNFGATYCSCGADLAGYPLYEL